MSDTTTLADAPPGAAPAAAVFSAGYRRTVLALLVAAYALNFIDRTIIITIGQAIKVDLKITDAQLGLLTGLYFALLYTILGIPIARFAERFSRVNIITGAILIWSAFTALCGMAGSYLALSVFRFGVGVGEAGFSPPAQSLISDYYPPKKRATALAIYSLGVPLGAMLGSIIGGWLAQAFSWRVAFMTVGLPGVAVAIAIRMLIKEPPRGHSEPEPQPRAQEITPLPLQLKPTLGSELKEIGAVVKILFGNWTVLNLVLGITLVSFGAYGAGQFVPPYFIRAFGLGYAKAGLVLGLTFGLSQAVGTYAGGALCDRLAKFSPRWYALAPAIGVGASYPFAMAVYNAPTWQAAALWAIIPGVLTMTYLGPTLGVIQNIAPTHRRATAAAIMLFVVNLVGLGLGPPLAGVIIDHLAAFHLAHPDQPGIWAALGHLFQGVTPFKEACPGGMAPRGAGPAAGAACHGALVLATRHGILLIYGVGALGALNYFLASFGVKKAMADARALRGEED